MFKLVHLRISAFRNVLNIGFDGTAPISPNFWPCNISIPIEVWAFVRNFKKSVRIPEEQGLQVDLWQLMIYKIDNISLHVRPGHMMKLDK